MADRKRFLVDVGIKDLPFPMKVASKVDPNGQPTIANISISARIMRVIAVLMEVDYGRQKEVLG